MSNRYVNYYVAKKNKKMANLANNRYNNTQ